MDYRKVHSAPKRMMTRGPELDRVVLATAKMVRDMVGATLGPGGQPVILEKSDDLPPAVTKDGVSVFKALGFAGSVQNTLMEAMRDSAVRTANAAGDGTTTATILAEALVRRTLEFCKQRRNYSPHRVVREIERAFGKEVQPLIQGLAVKCGLTGKAAKVLRQVALISANGDEELADAVMCCYEICGDAGNVTLVEAPGDSRYEVEEIHGYPMPVGYEGTLGPVYTEFLREPALHRTVLQKPLFVLYHGKITEFSTVETILEALAPQDDPAVERALDRRDILLVATWFSEATIASLTLNWKTRGTTKIMPLKVPLSGFQGGQKAFLDDLAAVVGATVYDPLTAPLETVTMEGLGALQDESGEYHSPVEAVEVGRDRTSVFGSAGSEGIELRTAELESALKGDVSKLTARDLTERIARLAGGIARLTVYGASVGETKEKVDRAEDAVCAVKGALKHGALYGGCWTLLQVSRSLVGHESEAVAEVLVPALREPFEQLLANVGIIDADEIEGYIARIEEPVTKTMPACVFDALRMELCDPSERGIYDSVPAVLEALRNSLSIATLLGTLGGAVVYARDVEAEREEAAAVRAHLREVEAGHYNVAELDEHGA